jgi:hypothetical protein
MLLDLKVSPSHIALLPGGLHMLLGFILNILGLHSALTVLPDKSDVDFRASVSQKLCADQT